MSEKEKTEKKEGEEKVVTLPEDTYSALLDRIAELEDSVKVSSEKKEVYSIDELTAEVKKKAAIEKETKAPSSEELDNMTNSQLLGYVEDVVNRAGLGLMTEIQTLKVMREIDRCEAKYDDFWDLEADIRKIASENPTLSIDKAYKLVKIDRGEAIGKKDKEKEGEEKEEEVSEKTTRTEKLLRLPPRSGGEKPGVARASTTESEIKTLKEAASKAWEEVVGKDKDSIK